MDLVGTSLQPTYDTRTPYGGMVFLRVRPPVLKMNMKMGRMDKQSDGGAHHDMNGMGGM